MKTKEDVIEALRKVHFLERTAELSQKFKRDYSADVKTARKDKVFAIISKLGYTPKFDYDIFRMKEIDDDEKQVIQFWFERPWVKFAFHYYDNGEVVLGGGPWTSLKKAVAASDDYLSGAPAYRNYEELEEIITTAVAIYMDSKAALFSDKQEFPNYDSLERIMANVLQMLEDFKYEFCKSKGIQYDRKNVVALEKEYIATEVRDIRPLV